ASIREFSSFSKRELKALISLSVQSGHLAPNYFRYVATALPYFVSQFLALNLELLLRFLNTALKAINFSRSLLMFLLQLFDSVKGLFAVLPKKEHATFLRFCERVTHVIPVVNLYRPRL